MSDEFELRVEAEPGTVQIVMPGDWPGLSSCKEFKTRAELEEFIGKLQIAAMVAWGVYRSDEKRK